jgi:cytochrome b pre-mRNA-processing protein 3
MSLLDRLLHRKPDPRGTMLPLYQAVVHRGRAVHWYVEGGVPDTLDGRFDMIAAVLTLVLLRLEQADLRHESVWLTELFIDDMEGQLRQIGIGDLVVGKHVGRMMSALGGRLSAYREGLAPGGDLNGALRRNLYRGEPVADAAVADVEARLRAFAAALESFAPERLLCGELPG